MPDTGWTEVVALASAYLIAVVTTPAGISGAILPPPFQATVLATPSPSVTPINLLYNVVATPGAGIALGIGAWPVAIPVPAFSHRCPAVRRARSDRWP